MSNITYIIFNSQSGHEDRGPPQWQSFHPRGIDCKQTKWKQYRLCQTIVPNVYTIPYEAFRLSHFDSKPYAGIMEGEYSVGFFIMG